MDADDPTRRPRAHGPIESISAVTLTTADMASATAFYRALGFRPVPGAEGPSFTTFRVGEGFLNLQLDHDHAPVPRIWGRVIFHVDDVDALYDRARAAGFEPTTEPTDAAWGERYFHLGDPDGHELSFARPLDR